MHEECLLHRFEDQSKGVCLLRSSLESNLLCNLVSLTPRFIKDQFPHRLHGDCLVRVSLLDEQRVAD